MRHAIAAVVAVVLLGACAPGTMQPREYDRMRPVRFERTPPVVVVVPPAAPESPVTVPTTPVTPVAPLPPATPPVRPPTAPPGGPPFAPPGPPATIPVGPTPGLPLVPVTECRVRTLPTTSAIETITKCPHERAVLDRR